jgi:hypothetical protein
MGTTSCPVLHRCHICEKLELSGNCALLKFAFDHKPEI